MIKIKWSKSGLWYTMSHKGESVNHLFRIGSTTKDGLSFYELIIWKVWIGFA